MKTQSYAEKLQEIAKGRDIVIEWATGMREIVSIDQLDAALSDDGAQDYEIGHDGDLLSHGDRTLVWLADGSAEDDDGARAMASLRWPR